MQRAETRARLEKAEQLVSDGERQVARLREMIAKTRRQGHDIQPTVNLLHQAEQALAGHIANRDRLRKELGL
jgi:hypothetical protein